MGKAVSVELDERLERFVEQMQRRKHVAPPEVSQDLMRAGYHDLVRQLHRQYRDGQLSLRAMATELGLEYRDLYALLEELDLPVA